MRKVFFVFILSNLVSLHAKAQFWIGGELEVKVGSTSLGSYKIENDNSVEIKPEIGWQFSDKWAVALRLGYAHFDNGEAQLVDQKVVGNFNQFTIQPFSRYVFYRTGNFSFFADGGISFSMLNKSNYDHSLFNIGLGISPGLRFAINDKVGLTGHLGNISYNHYWMEYIGRKLYNDTFKISIFDSVSLGVCFNL